MNEFINETRTSVYMLYQKEVQNIEHSFLQTLLDWIYNSNDSIYKYKHRNKAYLSVTRNGILLEQDDRSFEDFKWGSIVFSLKHLREIYVDKYHKDTCVLVSKISTTTYNNIWNKVNRNIYQSFQSLSSINKSNKSYLITVLKFKEGSNKLLFSIQKLDQILTEISKQENIDTSLNSQTEHNNHAKQPLIRQTSSNRSRENQNIIQMFHPQNLNPIQYSNELNQKKINNNEQLVFKTALKKNSSISRSFSKTLNLDYNNLSYTNMSNISSDNLSRVGYQQYVNNMVKKLPVSSTSSLRNSEMIVMKSKNNFIGKVRPRSSSMQNRNSSSESLQNIYRPESPNENIQNFERITKARSRKDQSLVPNSLKPNNFEMDNQKTINYLQQTKRIQGIKDKESDEELSNKTYIKKKEIYPSNNFISENKISNSKISSLSYMSPIQLNVNIKPPSPQILNLKPELQLSNNSISKKSDNFPRIHKNDIWQHQNSFQEEIKYEIINSKSDIPKESNRFKELLDLFNNYEKKVTAQNNIISVSPKNEPYIQSNNLNVQNNNLIQSDSKLKENEESRQSSQGDQLTNNSISKNYFLLNDPIKLSKLTNEEYSTSLNYSLNAPKEQKITIKKENEDYYNKLNNEEPKYSENANHTNKNVLNKLNSHNKILLANFERLYENKNEKIHPNNINDNLIRTDINNQTNMDNFNNEYLKNNKIQNFNNNQIEKEIISEYYKIGNNTTDKKIIDYKDIDTNQINSNNKMLYDNIVNKDPPTEYQLISHYNNQLPEEKDTINFNNRELSKYYNCCYEPNEKTMCITDYFAEMKKNKIKSIESLYRSNTEENQKDANNQNILNSNGSDLKYPNETDKKIYEFQNSTPSLDYSNYFNAERTDITKDKDLNGINQLDISKNALNENKSKGVLEKVLNYQKIVDIKNFSNPDLNQHQKKILRRRTFANMIWPMDNEEERIMRSNSPFIVPDVIVHRNDDVKSILKKNNKLISSNYINSFAKKKVDFHEHFHFVNLYEKNPDELNGI